MVVAPWQSATEESEPKSAGIGVNRCVSDASWALVPKTEAICGDGSIWFRASAPNQIAHVQGILEKAAEGIRTLDLLHGKQTL
jgi:hypothetical protein